MIFSLNFFYIGIYSASYLIPKSTVFESLNYSQEKGILKTPSNSIERSPSGANIDYGTECVALSIGLKDKEFYSGYKKYLSRFYEGYDDSGKNLGVFDPCSGLNSILGSGDSKVYEAQESYARNWWGISIIIQLLIFLFGLATTKMVLFNLLLILIIVFSLQLSKYTKDVKLVFLVVLPFLLFTDLQDVYQSTPYVLSYIQVFLSGLAMLNYLNRFSFNLRYFFAISLILGSIYNFIFWLNFHVAFTFVIVLLFVLHFRRFPFPVIYKRITVFFIGYMLGFICTTIFKWIISVIIFGNEITETIKFALNLRLSPGSRGLSESLMNYTDSFSIFPLPIRAIIINILLFGSKFLDIRYATFFGVIVIALSLSVVTLYFFHKYNPLHNLSKFEIIMSMPILLGPLGYFALTSNHSFNHAGVTYRSIAFVLSGFLSLLYLGKTRTRTNHVILN